MTTDLIPDTLATSARNAPHLAAAVTFNEAGLDFEIEFATDMARPPSVLRIPRSADVQAKIDREAGILDFVKPWLPVGIPDCKVVSPDLISIVVDAEGYAIALHSIQ